MRQEGREGGMGGKSGQMSPERRAEKLRAERHKEVKGICIVQFGHA